MATYVPWDMWDAWHPAGSVRLSDVCLVIRDSDKALTVFVGDTIVYSEEEVTDAREKEA
jgi:hypothetical protein